MNCLVVDDQKIFRNILKSLFDLDNSLVLVGECADAIEARQKIADDQIDLLFLDIRMPGMSGIELARILEGKRPLIIFTTSVGDYALEAFDLNVVDFLLKPILPVRFLKAVDKAKEMIRSLDLRRERWQTEYIFIRDSNVVRRLKLDDIDYFEATGDHVRVLVKGKDYFIHSSLKTIAQKLPPHAFLRVHRSFIVNLSRIDTLEGKTLLINHHFIPVSDAYRADLNKHMLFL